MSPLMSLLAVSRGELAMRDLVADLRYGLRILVRNPGFTLAAIVVLALGIVANTAIFYIVNAVLLRPLPSQDTSRIMQIWHVPPATSFPGMSLFSFSSGFFSILRLQPVLGRTFSAEEDRPGQGHVVILGHTLWRDHFAADPGIVGRNVLLDGQTYTVVGVMPPKFKFPDWAELWVPLAWSNEKRAVRGNHNYMVIGRLKPEVAVQQAKADLGAISARLEQQHPEDDKGWGATVVPLREQIVGDLRPGLLVLLGAVAFVLLIACANVANLVLAKTLARKKEIAIRTSLGASRAAVLRQILAETVLLSFAGGA